MRTVNVTYRTPEGDQPFVETRGVRFFDGQPVALDAELHAELIAKAQGNRHFCVEGVAGCAAPELGDAGGVEDALRGSLVAKAEELGLTVDGRWGLARLQAELARAAQAGAGVPAI